MTREGRRYIRIGPQVGNNAGANALAVILFHRAQEWLGGFGPAESTRGTHRIERASAPWDVVRHAVRHRLARVGLVLLVLIAVLISPIHRSTGFGSRRPLEGVRRTFAVPASEPSRLSVTAWILREHAVVAVTARSENDEDEEPCGAARQANAPCDPALSRSRCALACNFAVPGRLPALHPLRC